MKEYSPLKIENCKVGLLLLCASVFSSCEKFLAVDPPSTKIPAQVVFQDAAMATSALVGIYLNLYQSASFACGDPQSVVSLAGLSADELKNNKLQPAFLEFQSNAINPSGSYVRSPWATMYQAIYQANSAIEGLDASTVLSGTLKSQLKGEALFVRAFCYFYLVNLYGDVPLAVTTDYNLNNSLTRSPSTDVYDQIKADLLAAESLMADSYDGTERIRPNRFAATSLLARVYLYTGEWGRAEDKSTKVIESTLYNLETLNGTFLSTSKEAIWQIRPYDGQPYTNEGYFFGLDAGALYNVLTDGLMQSFESGDGRKTSWTTSKSSSGVTIYLPNKYKKYQVSGVLNEYSMVIRLAEVYLIRGEARARQNKLPLAIADIDKIRVRAGLPTIQSTNPGISLSNLMLAFEKERRIEFLAEWGHRWLDLKRLNRAEAVLSSKQPGWNNNKLLYPIPASEIRKNKNLNPQNPGY